MKIGKIRVHLNMSLLMLLLIMMSIAIPSVLSSTEPSTHDSIELHSELKETVNQHNRRLGEAKSGRSSARAPLTSSDISLCLIVKDDIDLEEWVSYHLALGVGRIYLYDNNSTRVQVIPMIHRFITSGQVVYRYLSDPLPLPLRSGDPPRSKNKQAHVYKQCIHRFKENHEFMGFIDADEYIVVKNPADTLISILERYTNYGGLTLNWMVFGTSGHVTRPPGGLLQNYYKCHPHRNVKSIVNTKYVIDIGADPHHFTYMNGYFAVDVNFTIVPLYANPWEGDVPNYLYETIYINHYELKSKEDYLLKVQRGRADLPDTPNPIERIEAIDSLDTMTCEFLRMPNPA